MPGVLLFPDRDVGCTAINEENVRTTLGLPDSAYPPLLPPLPLAERVPFSRVF